MGVFLLVINDVIIGLVKPGHPNLFHIFFVFKLSDFAPKTHL